MNLYPKAYRLRPGSESARRSRTTPRRSIPEPDEPDRATRRRVGRGGGPRCWTRDRGVRGTRIRHASGPIYPRRGRGRRIRHAPEGEACVLPAPGLRQVDARDPVGRKVLLRALPDAGVSKARQRLLTSRRTPAPQPEGQDAFGNARGNCLRGREEGGRRLHQARSRADRSARAGRQEEPLVVVFRQAAGRGSFGSFSRRGRVAQDFRGETTEQRTQAQRLQGRPPGACRTRFAEP